MGSKRKQDHRIREMHQWGADAALFIDAPQIDRFYDGVVRPATDTDKITLQATSEETETFARTFGFKADATLGALLEALMPLRPAISAEVKEQKTKGSKKGKSETVEMRRIKTPQRQLTDLMLQYALYCPDQLALVADPSETTWCSPESAASRPRNRPSPPG